MKQIIHLFSLVLVLLISTNAYTQTTYYSKSTATDFNDVNTWGTNADGTGTAPAALASPDVYIVANSAALTLSANAAVGKLTITLGSLTVSANQLDVAITAQNNSTLLVNGGTLNLSGTGNIVLNGNFLMSTGAFNQTGGSMTIDGNNNNVAATSVSSGTHHFSITGGTPNCSAGTITLVDPPSSTIAIQTTRAIHLSLAATNTAFTGTHTFVLGDGVSTTAGNTDGFVVECYSSGRVPVQNVTVNGGNATGRWGSTSFNSSTVWGTYIKGLLTINAGSEFTVNRNSTSANEFMVGSVMNDGIFTTARTTGSPILNIGVHSSVTGYVPTTASTISGTGVFRNLATSPTAQYGNIVMNNPLGINFDAGVLALGTYAGNASGTMTLTAGAINTNGQDFILGIGTGTLGSLTYTAGGFTSGSTFGRWFAATTAGTTISASAAPSTGTGTFPFIAGTNVRTFHLNRPTTTGATGGIIKVLYTDGVGMPAITPVVDGTYTVDKQSNASWTVSTGATFAAGTGTFTYAINGTGIYTPINTNARLMKSGTVTGTHQTGTTLPIVQRSAITAANFTGTFNIGASSLDIPTQTVQSGAWEDPATWGGAAPTCTSACVISNGHTVTVSASTTGNCASLNNTTGATLAVTGGSLTIGCTNNNALFSNGGTLNVSGGTLTVNGNISSIAASTFTQSGGDIIVDGNNANTTATSVATGTALVSFATNNLTLSGGKLTIVDPHAGAGTETAIAYTPSTTPYPVISAGHTTQFGDGVSTATGGSASGFRITQGTRLAFGNIIVNTLSGRYVYSSGNIPIYGNLTITNGEFQIQSGSTNLVAGNIENNGTLTTIGTLYLGTYTLPSTLAPSTVAQTISGTGIFKNAATSTANFANLTVNNTNAAGVTFANANSLLNGTNTGTVSSTLTLTAGVVSTGANAFVMGTTVGSVGTLTHTSGGFASGSTFTRWFPTAAGGTTIATATIPSVSSTGAFPFSLAGSGNRALWLQQVAAPTLGGKIAVTYNANGGGTNSVSIADGAYTVETQSKDSWAITTSGFTGTPTYTMAINAQSLYTAVNGNSRITLAAAPATGAHQNGTTFPHAQRTGLALADLTNTYYIGANNSDIPFQSIATGNWEDGTTWNKGVAPSCTDAVIIASGHNVTVNAVAASAQKITINSGGTLTVAGSTLTNGCTLNNNTLTNNGTLTVTGGTLNINGNLICAAASTFNQSGGNINIDGNGGAAGTNVASGTSLCQLSSQFINWTGGTLTIIDPHANATASESFTYTNSTAHVNVTTGHTLRFGDGVSTDAGGNATNGFRINSYAGSNRITFNNLEINTGTGTNRHVTMLYGFGINGDLTITSGEFRDNTTTIYVAKNLVNNGTYISAGALYLGTFLNGTAGVSANPQTISGTGIFSNNLTIASKTADVAALTINNNNATGVTFDRNFAVSGTLTMTSGVTTINSTYAMMLGTATATGTLNGTPSVTNMILGTFSRTFAIRTASGTYNNTTLFPLGAGATFLPLYIDPTTTAVSVISVKAYDSNTGTAGTTVATLGNARWEYTNTATGLTSAFFRATPAGLNNGKVFVQSPTATGTYDAITGATSTVAIPNLTSSSIPVATMTGFLSFGDIFPCTTPADQATNWTTTSTTTTTVAATYTAATSAPLGYVVVRYPTGGTPTAPVNLTTYAVGNTLGTGTIAYIGASTSINITGLVANTTYDFYVYAYNSGTCAGPVYNTTTPLMATVTTCAATVAAPTSSGGTVIMASGFQANWTASTAVGVTDQFLDVSTSSTYATLLAGYPLSVGVGTTNHAVTGLNASTTYYYRVRAVVGTCSSANSTSQTVITDCAAISVLPHTQAFATMTPTCWKNYGQGGTPATGPTVTTAGSWVADGFGNVGTTGAARANLYQSVMKSWLISPAFDLSTASYILKYKVGLTAYAATTATTLGSDDEVQVLGSTDGGVTWFNLKTYNASTPISNTGTLETIDISSLNTNNVKIAFWANEGTVDDAADNDFFIDDFSIELPPLCGTPLSVLNNATTSTTADFSWTTPSFGLPIAYNWEIRTSGAGGSGATGLATSGITSTASANVTGLTAQTTYSFYVQTDCGSGTTSTWVGPLVIATPCANTTIPVIQNFEGSTTLTNCWKSTFVSGTKAFSIGTTTTATGTSPNPAAAQGTNRLLFPSYTTSGNQTRLISPPIDASTVPSIDVKFQWYESTLGSATSYLTEGVQVQYSYDGINWTNSGTLFRRYGATTGWYAKKEVLTGSVPTLYIGFLFTSNAGYDAYLDDVNIDASPSCIEPTALSSTAITATTADLTWTAPALGTFPAGYNWEIRTSGAGGSGATGLVEAGISVTTSATTNVPLMPTTTYNFYVQSDCGAGSTSVWAGPYTFTTPCASVSTFPYLEALTTFLPGCWDKKGEGGTPATGPTAASNTGSWVADGFINSGTTGATKVNLYSNTKNSWLISPTFNLSNISTTYQLKYKVALTTWNGTAATTLGSDDEVQTLISTDGGVTWSSLKSYTSSTVISNTGVTESIDLTGYTSNNVKIAFWATEGTIDDTPDNDFFLDDIAVIELANCTSSPAATVASSTSSSVCAGSDIVLNATGLLDNQNGLVYQWQESTNSGAIWTDIQTPISGATTSSITVTGVSVATSYRLSGSCSLVGGTSTSSNQVDISLATITGGTTAASATSVCPSTTTSNTTLSLTGATVGVTYQWQSSTNGTTFTDITGATSATYAATVSTPTYFQCEITCGFTTDISTPIQITMKPATQCYCIPVSTGSSCISNVAIGTINNTSATCVSPFYSVQTPTTSLIRGQAHSISVTTNAAAIISVWIDYNQNGAFEATEWQQVATASTTNVAAVATVNIPATALLGTTGMRIRSRATLNANGSGDACTAFGSGECEDYFIDIADANFVTLDAKVYLNNYDSNTSLLIPYYPTAAAGFPTSDPYAVAPLGCPTCPFVHVNNATVVSASPTVLAQTGATAIVDWLFLELRSGASGATTVTQTKSVLLQANGKIVEANGTSPVKFNGVAPGNYFVTVRHRNHLGFRTDATQALNASSTPTVINLTDNSTLLYGVSPVVAHPISTNIYVMNGGDSNSDGSIDSQDSGIWEVQNGSFDDYNLNADYNLDGSIDGVDSAIWEINNGKYQELD